MVNLYSQEKNPFEGQRFIAAAITGSEDQRHAGIFYRTGLDGETHFLHLAFHLKLRREAITPEICWIDFDRLDLDEQQALALWIDSIWRVNGNRVPYGFNFSNSGHFNNTGAFTASDTDGGLTCATFILAIFEDYGFPLIDRATSYRRDDDVAWQNKIMALLEQYAPQGYAETQRNFIGIAARYRPEEVVGASSLAGGSAITFDASIDLGSKILTNMRELGSLLP